ncbi:J domain-containing protein [Persicobacter diffluens]|uniref:Molecular chaperone DnaJ n=1 Tax=Persicobacter diffluens TaxID=981 RepID=A0AAN4VYM9_9BACT|nr:hypothetical protein PEDI_24190 [Persicobacter diffluens]
MSKIIPLQVNKSKETLSKEQRAFNRFTKQIENLHKKIGKEEDRLEQLLALYQKEVYAHKQELTQQQILLVKKMDKIYQSFKYNKGQKQTVNEATLFSLDVIFSSLEDPDEELIAIFNRHSPHTFEEEMEMQTQDMLGEMEQMMSDMFGVDMDFSGMTKEDMESPEKMAEMEAKIKAQIEGRIQEEGSKKKTKKKTKRQLEKELEAQQEEKEKLRSLKSIYHALAKMLHPDTASSEADRLEKEELMKEVTEAYKTKDLPSLLRLEMKWLMAENDHLENLTDKQLKAYNQVLKEQIEELKQKLHSMCHHPRYESISSIILESLRSGKKEIKDMKVEYMEAVAECAIEVSRMKTRKALLEHCEILNEEVRLRSNPFDLFEAFMSAEEEEGEEWPFEDLPW